MEMVPLESFLIEINSRLYIATYCLAVWHGNAMANLWIIDKRWLGMECQIGIGGIVTQGEYFIVDVLVNISGLYICFPGAPSVYGIHRGILLFLPSIHYMYRTFKRSWLRCLFLNPRKQLFFQVSTMSWYFWNFCRLTTFASYIANSLIM